VGIDRTGAEPDGIVGGKVEPGSERPSGQGCRLPPIEFLLKDPEASFDACFRLAVTQ
jgi:hypothetical protein